MEVRRFDNVWDAIADTTEEAAKLGQRVCVELEAA